MTTRDLAEKILDLFYHKISEPCDPTCSKEDLENLESLLSSALEESHCKVRCGCFAYQRAQEEAVMQFTVGLDRLIDENLKRARAAAYEEGKKYGLLHAPFPEVAAQFKAICYEECAKTGCEHCKGKLHEHPR